MAKNAKIIREHQRQVVKELQNFITIMGVEAVKHYKASFRNQGFTDNILHKWGKREREDRNTKKERAILVKSGDLRRSIKVVRRSLKSVTIGSDLPYAQVHNDGLRAGRGKGFRMPKRQFVGKSNTLSKILMSKLDKRIAKIFK
jgi:phage gpG-like protein